MTLSGFAVHANCHTVGDADPHGEGEVGRVRILVSGGTGLIGSALRRAAESAGHETGLLVRREVSGPRQWHWEPSAGSVPDEAIEWADAVVNLSGASIGRVPWTKSYRRELVLSRVTATRTLVEAIARVADRPSVLVSGSAVGHYGDRPGETLDESSKPGRGFLSYVTRRWEAEAREAEAVTRVATLRTGLVLADGGALGPLMLATRLGVGARVGSGDQIWPWIALDDAAAAILHVITGDVFGPVNLVAPARTTSEEVTRTLADVMHRPHLLVLPAPLLRIPLGPAADELLLLSQHIEPAALLGSGFGFRVPDVREALELAVHGGEPRGSIEVRPPTHQPEPRPREEGAVPQASEDGLANLTVTQLRERAKELGITGYSRRTKAELIEMLRTH